MNPVEERVRTFEAPGEQEAGDRAWTLVRAALAEREPVAPGGRRALRPALVLAGIAAALVAAAVTPPGRAMLDEVREAIGVERARPALFSLPSPGRLLVESDAGVWVVQRNGSQRLLAGYREASWSPYGAYVVATRRNSLRAVEGDGDVRWSLSRPNVTLARWGGTRTDTRIAYLSGRRLRVVAGDGTGDREVDAPVTALAWNPTTTRHVLAYIKGRRVFVRDADTGALQWQRRLRDVRELVWSPDGRRLLVVGTDALYTFERGGRHVSSKGVGKVEAVAYSPDATRVAVTHRLARGRSETLVLDRDLMGPARVFVGAGRFPDLAWSPDGRWLLVTWRDANQWVFVRSARVRRIRAFSHISRQFESDRFPTLAGWCCP